MLPSTVRALAAGVLLAAVPAWAGTSCVAAWAATASAHRRIAAIPDASVIHLTAHDGVSLTAWRFDPPPNVRARGTVVLGHGYRDDRRQLIALAPSLTARGLRVIALDFRGHGESAGDRITVGVRESRDVVAALDAASLLGGPVGYVGFSMGAAAYLLSGREADAAVLDSPYDTLTEAVGARIDFFRLPRALGAELVRQGARRVEVSPETVRPIDRVPSLTRPTLFIFGSRDRWLSAATRQRFREHLPHGIASQEVVDGGHADHFTEGWVARVSSFLDRSLETVSPAPRSQSL